MTTTGVTDGHQRQDSTGTETPGPPMENPALELHLRTLVDPAPEWEKTTARKRLSLEAAPSGGAATARALVGAGMGTVPLHCGVAVPDRVGRQSPFQRGVNHPFRLLRDGTPATRRTYQAARVDR